MLKGSIRVAIIVAHPDDEILWAGGTLLIHNQWQCHIICLCRKYDIDRSARFNNVLRFLGVWGAIGNLDDGPEQYPLDNEFVCLSILNLLPSVEYDLIITHSPNGEYTRHLRHEEIGYAVISLWIQNKISCNSIQLFAYQDDEKTHYPLPIKNADVYTKLPDHIWQIKYNIIKDIYGFKKDSWEAITTPKDEAFWRLYNVAEVKKWLNNNYLL